MASTQQFIPIKEIKDDLVFLSDGTVNLVIVTSAVNFGLLFETEQISIIQSFAGMLNSLSFPIQILILSNRLDVSSYLHTLDQALASQTNPKLKNLTVHYKGFVESIIKERNVLDKKFYLSVSVSPFELGFLGKNSGEKSKKAATVLAPRRDHLIRQLGRLGLKAKQLSTAELTKLFYEIYNPVENTKLDVRSGNIDKQNLQPNDLKEVRNLKFENNQISNFQHLNPASNIQHPTSIPTPPQAISPQTTAPPPVMTPPPNIPPPITSNLHPPFVVEELSDDFGP